MITTTAEHMQAAMTACHDAAYREAFIAGLSALHVLITWSLGTRTLTKKQVADIKNAYGALMQAAEDAAKPRWNGHNYDHAIRRNTLSDSTATPLVPPCLHLTEPGPPSPPSEPGFVPDDIDRIPVIYIAGPYSAEDPISIERNVRRAEEACYEIEALGACAICPHTNTRWQDSRTPYEQKCRSTMAALRRCDAVFWLADWQQSKGARAEHIDAEARGKVMLYTLAQVQTYITVCRGVAR